MRPNQLYLYLNYILEKRLNTFPIRQCQARSGQKYLYIPLLAERATFIHSEYGEVRVKDTHLSCFEEVSEKSYNSDIHFTCTLITSTDETKIHMYQNEECENIGIYSKNLHHPEQVFILSLNDLKILNDSARQLTMQIRCDFLMFLKRTQAQYEHLFSGYRMMTIREQDELELQTEQIDKMLENLEILSLFKPEIYQSALLNMSEIKSEKIQLLEHQKSIESARGAAASEQSLLVQKEFLNLEIIKTTRQFCYILDKVLQQTAIKLDISKAKTAIIHHNFEVQVKESIKLYQVIQEHLALLEPMSLSPEALRRYEYVLMENECLLILLKELCTSYFSTMVLCQNYRDMDLIEPYLNRPQGACIRNIIRNEPTEILPRLIQRFEISLTERVLDIEPYSIIEYALQENKQSILAELVHHFSIDFTYRLANNRYMVMALNHLNLETAWKLIENYEQRVLSSDSLVLEQEAVRASIAARTEFMSQARRSENRSFINRLIPGVMRGVSEIALALEYEHSYAIGRISEIERNLKNFRCFSFARNMALVEEKNKLLMITMLCSAVSPQYSNAEYIKSHLYSKLWKSTEDELLVEYYAKLPGISAEVLENIRRAKEYIKLFTYDLPGNSYHIIAIMYFDRLLENLKSLIALQDDNSLMLVEKVDSFILTECERLKSIL